VAKELRSHVEEVRLEHKKSLTAEVVTLSLGVATLHPKDRSTPEALVSTADAALYRAKREGRNRVRWSSVSRDNS
jgi:two-component system chemotaxis family response regulator WspR